MFAYNIIRPNQISMDTRGCVKVDRYNFEGRWLWYLKQTNI